MHIGYVPHPVVRGIGGGGAFVTYLVSQRKALVRTVSCHVQ